MLISAGLGLKTCYGGDPDLRLFWRVPFADIFWEVKAYRGIKPCVPGKILDCIVCSDHWLYIKMGGVIVTLPIV